MTTRAAAEPFYDADVEAVCDPPAGWVAKPLVSVSDHAQQIWVSPTGDTAYGVIHFNLPLPFIGQDLALSGFLSHMKQSEGQANLIERKNDSNLPGIRFVAEGGRYKIRANLIVKTWEGWTIFAGTRAGGPINSDELDIAEQAREHTKIGRPDHSGN